MKHLRLALPFFGLAVLALQGCQNEEIEPAVQEKATVQTLQGTVSLKSRAQVALGGTGETEQFMWNSGDQFAVFRKAEPAASPIVFDIDANYNDATPSNSATFNTTSTSLKEGDEFVAVYPHDYMSVTNNEKTLLLNRIIPMTDGVANWSEYMKQNMYMTASATAQKMDTNLNFSHLISMVRVTYHNATGSGRPIQTIGILGDGDYYASDATFNVITQQIHGTGYASLGYNFNDNQSVVVPTEGEYDFYLIFFPVESFTANGWVMFEIDDGSVSKYSPQISTSVISAKNNGAAGFEAGKRYWFDLTETSEGIFLTANMPEDEFVEFEDATFKSLVVAQYDTDGDGEISFTEAAEVTDLLVNYANITSLKGVEQFSNLRVLSCKGNQLTTLDVSNCAALVSLNCGNNNLTTLVLPNENTTRAGESLPLAYLNCENNKLTELNLCSLTSLESFECSENQLTELDVNDLTKLASFKFGNNKIKTIDLSANTALISLTCNGNQLAELDLTSNVKLSHLFCYANQISGLNLNANTALEQLYCNGNQLTRLDLTSNTELQYLTCSDNQLSELDLSANTALINLTCNGNQLTELDLTSNTELQYLTCSDNQLSELDLSANTKLVSLGCSANQLTNLDLSANTELATLHCQNNQLSRLDISSNVNLQILNCSGNRLDALDISANEQLMYVWCGAQQDDSGDSVDLVLKVSEGQIENLERIFNENDSFNENVTIDDGTVPSAGTIGNDFQDGGKF